MGHIIRLQSREQFVAALRVLDNLPGMWHSRGPIDAAELLVLDNHYEALINAGIVAANGKEGQVRAKKNVAKKAAKS